MTYHKNHIRLFGCILIVSILTACNDNDARESLSTDLTPNSEPTPNSAPTLTHTVTTIVGENGAISPTSIVVDANSTANFVLAPNAGYSIANVTGCGGTLDGTTYMTAAITSDCTVSASFNTLSYEVTAQASNGGSITPASQMVNHNGVTTLHVTADTEYTIAGATGCGGTLNGSTYTTAAVTSECTVNSHFNPTPTGTSYNITINIPEASSPSGRNANTAASFAIIDVDRTTGKIVNQHSIKSANLIGDGSWIVVLDSDPNANRFIVINRNDDTPDVCTGCDLPDDSIFAPLDELNIEANTLSTLTAKLILDVGEEISLQQTIELIDRIQPLSSQLPPIEANQIMDDYFDKMATHLQIEINKEYFFVTKVSIVTGLLNDTGSMQCSDYAYSDSGTYAVTGSGTHNNLDCSIQQVVPDQSTDGIEVPATGGDIIRGGQDVFFGRDVTHNDDSDGHAGFSFTKLHADGNPLIDQTLDYATQPWECVRDNVTGLIWEVKKQNGIQWYRNSYTWYNSTGINDGGNAGTACEDRPYPCDSEKYAAAINTLSNGSTTGLCGYTNWRLPSHEELRSIVNLGRREPAIDTNYFPNTIGTGTPNNYLTFNTSPSYTNGAYNINFIEGNTGVNSKQNENNIRLVRGEAEDYTSAPNNCTNRISSITLTKPDTIYRDPADGTITDKITGLMWQKCSLGLSGSDCDTGDVLYYSWQSALAAANENSDFGFSDWRLPNAKELESLAEVACLAPHTNENIFPNAKAYPYWSSTPAADSGNRAWYFSFLYADAYRSNKNSDRAVRLVRDP